MPGLRWLTAGESHGKALVAVIEGLPAGVPVTAEAIDRDLVRRMRGYGRNERLAIERDRVAILAGVRHRRTIGAPVALLVANLDYPNWEAAMDPDTPPGEFARKIVPYPGHADLPGAMKYGFRDDLRSVTERASARETAARVAAGAVARGFLSALGIAVHSHVVAIGGETAPRRPVRGPAFFARAERSDVRCASPEAARRFRAAIDRAKKRSDSVGGVFEVVAFGLPPGLGSHVHWDRKLSTRLVAALASINAIKGVEIGDGFAAAGLPGRKAQDALLRAADGSVRRRSNHAGGLEGGMTNGEPLVLRAAMKPISSAVGGMPSVDLEHRRAVHTRAGRSDVCAVPAAAVVGEAMACLVLADAALEKFGGDSLAEVLRNRDAYVASIGLT
jgi:chorismate synthase